MTEKRIVYRDGWGVRRTMILDDEHPDRVVVHTEQNVEGLMTSIAARREELNQRGPLKVLASIPVTHADRVIGMDDDELKHFLNDSENEAFRIWRGRV